MIESLMEAKLISAKQFKVYRLYGTELGQEVLKDMMDELFWEEPDEPLMTEGVLGFYEGRRSILRGVKTTLETVQELLRKQQLEVNNDGTNNT